MDSNEKLTNQQLQKLLEGNKNFVATKFSVPKTTESFKASQSLKQLSQAQQKPFAIILSCADSRVVPELLFEQSIGDLFVIRVAGNVVTPTQLGSIEFAVEQFGVKLIMVLGHSNCGAIKASLNMLGKSSPAKISVGLKAIVDEIMPSVKAAHSENKSSDSNDLLSKATVANVINSVKILQTQSPLLTSKLASKELAIIGANYSLETGIVSIL